MRRATNSLPVHLTFTVDKETIQADKEKVLETVQDLGHQGRDKTKAPGGDCGDDTPSRGTQSRERREHATAGDSRTASLLAMETRNGNPD